VLRTAVGLPRGRRARSLPKRRPADGRAPSREPACGVTDSLVRAARAQSLETWPTASMCAEARYESNPAASDLDAIRMQSYAISIQSAYKPAAVQHAISMQSACNQYAISMHTCSLGFGSTMKPSGSAACNARESVVASASAAASPKAARQAPTPMSQSPSPRVSRLP
jgi:hypothetical protein